MHPLLDEFFNYSCIKNEAIRVHCTTPEERMGLLDLVSQYKSNFFAEYLTSDPRKVYNHTYFFWDREMIGDGDNDRIIGFNSYAMQNSNTYEFVEFMAIVTQDMQEEAAINLEELL